MIIAIDGPSGTGKSTVAKAVAKRLGFTFFDTGAMYRSLAWFVIQEGISPADEEKVVSALARFQYEIQTDAKGDRHYFVNGTEVTGAIREAPISPAASQVAKYAAVRKTLVKIQREFGSASDAVFEGRDMGTVVFPKADLKIYLTANADVRAQRRYQELLAKFPALASTTSLQQVQRELEERDQTDMNRPASPLKQAPDAHLVDTSNLSVDQVVSQILSLTKGPTRMKPLFRCIHFLAKTFFKLCFRLKVYGLDHLTRGSGIIAANHCSNYDPPVLSVSCPEEVHFLAKESLFEIPLLGRLIRALNSHPIARGASDTQTFRVILKLLGQGQKVILFPEGSRSYDGELQPIERGLAFLVQKAHCTIFPAYIGGTYRAWPRNGKPKFFGKITCVFGTPIEWAQFEGLDKREAERQITEKMGSALRDLKAWYDAGARGAPP